MTRPKKDGLKRAGVRRVTKDEQILNLEQRLGQANSRAEIAGEILASFVNVLWNDGGLKRLVEMAVEEETSELDGRISELEDNVE